MLLRKGHTFYSETDTEVSFLSAPGPSRSLGIVRSGRLSLPLPLLAVRPLAALAALGVHSAGPPRACGGRLLPHPPRRGRRCW